MPSLGLIILLLLVALPLLEIAILIKVGSMIGVWATLFIIVTTFILGTWVLRLQGMGIARRFMAATRSGEPPVEPVMEAMLLMMAGGCLIAPGFITDTIGLLLLIPLVRQVTARLILDHAFPLAVKMNQTGRPRRPTAPNAASSQPRRSGSPPTIEADYERIDERPITPRSGPPGDPPV